MTSALDDIRFLADSEHRSVVLEELASGPRTRDELREATGASSATIGRILGDFDDRSWVVRDGRGYALTTLGEFVSEKFEELHESMRTTRALRGLLPYLPLEEMGIGVDRLAGARITQPTVSNPLALASRLREIELEADHARSLTMFFPEPCVDARYRAVVEGRQTFEAVFTPNAIETAMTSPLAGKFLKLVAADRMTMYFFDGDLPWSIFLNDGVACFVVRDDAQTAIGFIETEDPEVVEFAADQFATYRDRATPYGVEQLRAEYGA